MTLQSISPTYRGEIVVVTHQHSGDPAMLAKIDSELSQTVVTHQHSGDPAIIMKNSDLVMIGRNSPTFW